MTLQLIRNTFADDGILGQLVGINGTFICDTLEHSYAGLPKLPEGDYVCKRGKHQLHSGPVETFEVIGVPGHAGILFHVGNTNKDSEGCVLLGERYKQANYLLNSRNAFGHFLDAVNRINEFSLQVINKPGTPPTPKED